MQRLCNSGFGGVRRRIASLHGEHGHVPTPLMTLHARRPSPAEPYTNPSCAVCKSCGMCSRRCGCIRASHALAPHTSCSSYSPSKTSSTCTSSQRCVGQHTCEPIWQLKLPSTVLRCLSRHLPELMLLDLLSLHNLSPASVHTFTMHSHHLHLAANSGMHRW